MSRTLRIAILALGMIAVILGMIAMYARDLKGGTEITLKTEPVDPRSLFLGHYATLGYAINRLDGSLLDHCYASNAPIFVTLEPDEAGNWSAVKTAPKMPADGFGERRVTLRGRVQWGERTYCVSASARSPAADEAEAFAEASAVESVDPASAESLPVESPVELATEEIPETGAAAGEPLQDETIEPLTEPIVEPERPFSIWVAYGIEQYFASPDAARKLEDLARRRPTADGEPEPEPLEIILSVPNSGRALIKGVVIDGEKTYDQTLW